MLDSFRNLAKNPKLPDRRKRSVARALDLLGRIAFLPLLPWLRRSPPGLGENSRILLLRTDGIGDFVMSTHLIPALRSRYPKARIDLLCNRWSKDLADLFLGAVDRVEVLGPDHSRPAALWALIGRLRRERYDVSVDLRGDFRMVLLGWASGARRRLGYSYGGFDYLLTDIVEPSGRHQVIEVAAASAALDAPILDPRPALPLRDEHRRRAEAVLRSMGVAHDEPLIAMHVVAGQPSRRWPLERFNEVARRIGDRYGARIVLFGGGSDSPDLTAIARDLPVPGIVLAGKTTLAESAAVLERCRLLVAVDSGVAHLAAAVGCPSVVLWGPADDAVTRPWGGECRLLRTQRACGRHCYQAACSIPDRHCMLDITPDQVLEAVDDCWNRAEARSTLAPAEAGTCS